MGTGNRMQRVGVLCLKGGVEGLAIMRMLWNAEDARDRYQASFLLL